VSHLFTPLKIGQLTLANRIVIAPMCQYSAKDGRATDWHTIHLGSMATSGAGLLFLEDTAISARGRITTGDLGLWDDATEAALGTVLATVRKYTAMPIGIQLGHAGRKSSTALQWLGGAVIGPDQPGGWSTIAPSAVPFHDGAPAPVAASAADIATIVDDFASAARRAARLGLDVIELQGAHGYLLHQFLSPLSNLRTDAYGGSLENRMRLLLEVFDAVRAAFPADRPVGVRISATDWVEGGWDVDQSIVLAGALERRGCAFIHVSSSGLSALQKIPAAPGFQVPLAAAIKQAVAIPVIAVGMITSPAQAEAVLAEGKADAIALARGILSDPHWAWRAAAELSGNVHVPPQYLRAAPPGVALPLAF